MVSAIGSLLAASLPVSFAGEPGVRVNRLPQRPLTPTEAWIIRLMERSLQSREKERLPVRDAEKGP